MPTDIFPDIDIPVISVIWNYGGLPPEEMEKRIVTNFERFLTTTVNDIEHIESQTLTGIADHQDLSSSRARTSTRRSRRSRRSRRRAVRQMPPGATPPLIMQLQRDERADHACSRSRATRCPSSSCSTTASTSSAPSIATIPGAQIPWPYGGKQRQIMVDIDPPRLYALRPVAARRAGRARRAERDPADRAPRRSASTSTRSLINVDARDARRDRRPADQDGRTARRSTCATSPTCATATSPQTNMVHVEGQRSVLMAILKNGDASTLDVADARHGRAPARARRGCRRRRAATCRQAAVRSVGVRARVDRRRRPGGADRRRPHRR